MKKFLIRGLLLICFIYFVRGSIDEERRFRQGDSFSRKLRSCNLTCFLEKSRSSSYNQTRCYIIPSQNLVVTDCVFKCLRSKGESFVANECTCRNGACEEETTTPPPTTDNSTSEITTNRPNYNPKNQSGNPTNNSPQSREIGNQGKKRAKSQNSKRGNQSTQKS